VNDPNFSLKYVIELDKAVLTKKLEKLGIQSVRAKQMKLAAEQIYARHHGAIPEEKSDLCNLSGVGQKITQLVREFIFNKKEDVSFHMPLFVFCFINCY